MEKKIGKMKKFFGEFKKFIMRGNVLDMAVGVIVGGAFTGIVNGLSNYILKPIINCLIALILGKDGLEGAITMLSPAYTTDEAGNQIVDLANSIYIDWGSFISAVINFLIIAFVLFMIVRTMNKIAEAHERVLSGLEMDEKKAIAKICYEEKVGRKKAKEIYAVRVAEAKAKKAAEEAAALEAMEKAAAEAEAKEMANTRLLEEIRDILKNK